MIPKSTPLVVVLTVLVAGVLPRVATAQSVVAIEVNRPRSIFECDTPVGEQWYGSADRCLRELCAGQNVTNAQLVDVSGHLRRNPCYGRDPFELQD